MGLRSNAGSVVDRMWKYMGAVFRAVGKKHYARLSVLSQYVMDHLDNVLKEIWAVYRTLSLRGNIGRNVGWDFGCERLNLECQEFMGACVTKERLLEAISILNGIRHVRNQTLSAFGVMCVWSYVRLEFEMMERASTREFHGVTLIILQVPFGTSLV